jgi:hypothetical protein
MDFLRTYEEFDFNPLHHLFRQRLNRFGDANDVVFISNNFANALYNIPANPLKALFQSLKNIDKDKLVDKYANYLDVDEKGNVSYLDGKYLVDEPVYKKEFFIDKRRQNIKVTKLLPKVLKPEFIPNDQVQVEKFINGWKTVFDSKLRVEEFIGEDILRAYNYKQEVMDSGGSCALFPNCGKKSRFDVLVNNPDTFSAIVCFEDKYIIGRRVGVQGVQCKTEGYFKEGTHYKFLNNFYGRGGTNSQADIMITNFAKASGYDAGWGYDGLESYKDNKKLHYDKDVFRIKVPNLDQKEIYPSFDIFGVNFKLGEIASYTFRTKDWQDFYGASPPAYLKANGY